MAHPQDEAHHRSLTNPEAFWGHQAEYLDWHRKPSAVLARTTKHLASGAAHAHWEWFPGGEISTCHNCLDRHVLAGNGDTPAIFYDSPVTGTKQRITYGQLLREVEVFAAVLREEGVSKGDVVLVYMPMIPAALIGILAINRLGAIHTVVFGGFAAGALAQRIEASRPVAVLTASCGIDGNKPPIPYRDFVEEAIRISAWKPPKTVIWQREQLPWRPIRTPQGQRTWQSLVESARARGLRAECVPVKSTDPVYIIYTSGTTGLPKGVLREAGGHAVGLHLSISYLFGIRGPGDVMGCFSDIGWVVSHSYTLYGPLLAGAATVLYEGKPVGTPDASAFWRLVDEYRISVVFTAPTALRAIRRADPASAHLARVGARGGLRSLRALFLAGERSEPALVALYQALLGRYGAEKALVVDNWWSSESGSPISGIALLPRAGMCRGAGRSGEQAPLDIKLGSAGKAMPGFDVRVVDDEGQEVPREKMGNIVLAPPLAPTAFRTLWQDEERFYRGYLKRFGGRWLDTGDAGCVDESGYIHVMARTGMNRSPFRLLLFHHCLPWTRRLIQRESETDDIINVAAHRLSTGALEQAITSHPRVTEACVVAIPDALKGHLPFAFVATSSSSPTSPEGSNNDDNSHQHNRDNDNDNDSQQLFAEIQSLIRTHVGPIASLGGMIHRPSSPPPPPLSNNNREKQQQQQHDPQDAVRQDAPQGAEGAARACSAGGV
ncbi:acetyl-CoA synthetase-like protein [Parathielavia hyrcaniae]|uniref:Acetyl-CoA synthetase-like protein n=1 Tax=Parathielavia hyrcaniae TaxID=113614 RepID=A0AAN6Q654_9PEZI|nr:acetyl-CoA synthetase-like protein [Parathielavia hyrcaniae]